KRLSEERRHTMPRKRRAPAHLETLPEVIARVATKDVLAAIVAGLRKGDPRMVRLWAEWRQQGMPAQPVPVILELNAEAERLLKRKAKELWGYDPDGRDDPDNPQ
ncbi:MAG TPA: hypothetical protein VGS41_12900, partial [Chthonomonadales bacterium]|nr:hypothetical protein [Chthonomonadales bacterium]